MGIGAVAVNYYSNQNVQYGVRSVPENPEASFGDEISGSANI